MLSSLRATNRSYSGSSGSVTPFLHIYTPQELLPGSIVCSWQIGRGRFAQCVPTYEPLDWCSHSITMSLAPACAKASKFTERSTPLVENPTRSVVTNLARVAAGSVHSHFNTGSSPSLVYRPGVSHCASQVAPQIRMFFVLCLQEPGIKQLTWNSSGPAVSKAISCAEIMKRKIKVQNDHTSVADPGFPWGGGGRQPIIWPIFPENCMKIKKFWAWGGARVPRNPM